MLMGMFQLKKDDQQWDFGVYKYILVVDKHRWGHPKKDEELS